MPTLTKKQKEIFDFIKNYIKKNEVSPTFDEISEFIGRTFSTAHEHVNALIKKGLLIKNGYLSRGIEIKENNEMVLIPLLGSITAGRPMESTENKEIIAVPKYKLSTNGNYYALRVNGESMIEEGVNNNDIILVKQQQTAVNGQKVIALINNNETTLKKFYEENGHIRLQPANKFLKPIIIPKRSSLEIQGIMIDVIKSLPGNINFSAQNKTVPIQRKKELPLNKIICGDCVEVMKSFPNNSVDLIITSPPYDDVRKYKGFTYDLHTTGKEINRILKDGGIAAMVIQDQTKNFGKTLTSFKTIIDWCDNFGFKLFETVIYRKYGAEGAWWNKRFRVDHEYMPIFLKGERPQYFNKEPLKIPSKHGGKTMTGGGTRLTNGIRIPTRSITINPMKCRGTIWEYMTAGDGTRLKHQHPATFPDKLPYDFIQCFCPPKGVVLDPFIGSGTTALAAMDLDRNYIGIDISNEYCELTKKRLKEEGKKTHKLF